MKTNFVIFDSVTDFCAAEKHAYYDGRRDNWTGPRSLKEATDYLRRGASESETKEARDLVNKIDAEIHERAHHQWAPSPFGAYPVVPDYLAGDPFSMRHKVSVASDAAPVHVVLNISVAAGMKAGTIAKRGAAMAAFAMKLAEHRPVELWISSAFHNSTGRADVGWRCKLDMPMNVSQVVAAFDRSVCRVMNFSLLEYLTTGEGGQYTNDSYPFVLKDADAYQSRDRFVQYFREYQKLEPDDVVLDAGILTDCNLIDRDPVRWVKSMLAKYGEVAED